MARLRLPLHSQTSDTLTDTAAPDHQDQAPWSNELERDPNETPGDCNEGDYLLDHLPWIARGSMSARNDQGARSRH